MVQQTVFLGVLLNMLIKQLIEVENLLDFCFRRPKSHLNKPNFTKYTSFHYSTKLYSAAIYIVYTLDNKNLAEV